MSSREIDDRVLTLSASGWTYRNRFVLYDYETTSLWFCLENGSCRFTCVGGEFADRKFEKLTGTITSWQEWKANHPDTKHMDY